jgi:hypothetical protein
MATISSIVIELKGKTAQLVKPMQGAVAAIKNLKNPIASAVKNAKKLGSAVAKAAKKIGTLAVAFKALSTAAAAGLFIKLSGGILETADSLDKVIKTANNLGVVVGELQKLQFQAGQSGIASADLTTTLRQLQRVTGEAGNGNKKAADTFKQLGISLESIKDANILEIFSTVSDSLKGLSSDTERASVANTLFGRNWLAILNLVRSDMDKTGAAFDKLGLKISDSQGVAIEAFNDARVRLGKLWDSFYVQLTARTASAFTAMIKWIEKSIISYGGMQEAAKKAADFIINGLLTVVDAAEGTVTAIQKISNAFQEISTGNFGRKIALLAIGVEKAFTKAKVKQKDLEGNYAWVDNTNYKELSSAQALLAKDIVSTEKQIENRAKNTASSFDKIRDSINKAREAIKSSNLETSKIKEPKIAKQVTEKKLISLDSIKEAEKLEKAKEKADLKKNSEADKYRTKIQMQNEQLKKQAQIMDTLAAKLKNVQGSTTFAGGLTALSETLSKANDDSLSIKERNAQRDLFNQSKVRFAGTDFNGGGGKLDGKIEISLSMNEDGIIQPILKSSEFNDEVSNIVVETVNKQARSNDR